MDYIQQGLASVAEWTQQEVEAHRQQIGGYISELRPRKRVRRQELENIQLRTPRNRPQTAPTPTLAPRSMEGRSPVEQSSQPTAPPQMAARDGGSLLLDTAIPPSVAYSFTGTTLPASLLAVGSTEGHGSATASTVTVTQSPSSTPQSSGLSGTTEAIVIAASVAGAIILISMIVVCSICYRRRKRKPIQAHPLEEVSRRPKSTSSMRSEGWHSDTSEPEKQLLMRSSRSPSPSARNQQTSIHSQQRSLGNYRPFLPQIPESPIGPLAPLPTSPTSIYTKAQSPPQPNDAGHLQVEQSLSPLRPPPLRLMSRRGSEAPNTAMLPSPQNPFSGGVRIPFISGGTTGSGRRRSSAQQSSAAGSMYDEERGLADHRRTVESDTLPKAGSGRWRDSFWSVAASSIWNSNNSNKAKSGYSDWNAVPSSTALSHTRSTSSSSSSAATASNRGRQSSMYSVRRPSEALIPALPPMPSAEQLQQQYGHKPSMSDASMSDGGSLIPLSAGADSVQLKGRLHSVDFWAREEREMRLGTFEPAELEGSPAALVPPPPFELSTPRDSTGEIIGAAVPGTPSKGFGLPEGERERGRETMSRSRLGADPYSNHSSTDGMPGPGGYGVSGGMQGGYSVAVSGGNSPPMPQGYTQESSDARRFWGKGRSRSQSKGRSSGSTVATVFRQHPGDMVMI